MKHDLLLRVADHLGLQLPEAAVHTLARYAELLTERAGPLGIIAAGDADEVLERHVLDCLRAAPHVRDRARAADLGSGAGLPGVPVAIARPDVSVTLLESQRRRVAFLEMVCDELGIANATVVHTRVEAFGGRADVCLARAFAPLRASWAAASPLLDHGGWLIYFAGASVDLSAQLRDVAPAPAAVRTVPPPSVLASAGTLVIMTLQ